MKCISLIQPWAFLVVTGAKRFETRSWATSYRGPLLIASSRRFPPECRDLCGQEPFTAALKRAGTDDLTDLPLGCILGLVDLVDCIRTQNLTVPEPERSFGNFRSGRYDWALANSVTFNVPIPYRGCLGLYDVPDQLIPGEHQPRAGAA